MLNNILTSLILFCCLFAGSCFLSACDPDEQFYTGSDAQIRLQMDTLRFDTVFTQKGSTIHRFKIYNDYSEKLNITSIKLRDETKFFTLNIDGYATNELNDLEILPHDSLYLFCKVVIDPDDPVSVSPFIIYDYVDFIINGNNQYLVLEAWGQNANYITSNAQAGGVALLSCNNQVEQWSDPKPYIIYGILAIDDCVLSIAPGTKIYVNGGVQRNTNGPYIDGLIAVLENGRLQANGTLDQPIIFQSIRTESDWQEIPGQWAGLRMLSGSIGNSLKHVQVKQSIVGVQVDSLAQIKIEASEFAYTSGAGLVALHANVEMENCLLHNNGGNAIQLIQGGNFKGNYLTLASYGNDYSALSMSNFLCYDADCVEFDLNTLNFELENSLVVGNADSEIFVVQEGTTDPIHVDFEHCMVAYDNDFVANFPDFEANCNACIKYSSSEPLFRDTDEANYYLDSLSTARFKAIPNAILFDKDEVLRDPTTPDLGCYTFVP